MNAPIPLQVLLLEDQPVDAELILAELRRAGFVPIARRVETEAEFQGELDRAYDLILADYSLPQYDAERALHRVQERGLDLPFIIVSGTIGEERAAAIMKEGATDYLLKDRLGRLGVAVRQALGQRTLRQEKEHAEVRFRALVEHASDIIAIIDAWGKLRYASPALERVLGLRPQDALGSLLVDLVHPEDMTMAQGVLVAALAQPGQAHRGEIRLRHRDGTWHWLEVIATNLLAEPGAISGVVVNARDVTERDYARKLEELATLRADFTAMVAHELGSRIAAIRRYTDLLAIDPLSPIQDEALASIQTEVVSLRTLVADAHAAATVDRDDFAVFLRPIPVETLMAEVVSFARTLPGEHPLVTDVAATGEVLADPIRIGQVLRNLLSNAAKYSPPGSCVTLRVKDGGCRVRIEVTDSGYGIAAEDVPHIFEKYGRGRNQAVRHIGGVGLGLYLSRRITQAHGSNLTVTSMTGKGSTFGFDLEQVR